MIMYLPRSSHVVPHLKICVFACIYNSAVWLKVCTKSKV